MSSKARLLLLLPAADLIFVVGLLVYLEAGSEWDSWSAGLLAYNLLSPVGLAALVVLTAGLWPRGMPVTAGTCVLFSGLLVAAMLDMFSSSTGVLLLLFLPILFCVALVPFAGLGVLVHWLRGRDATSSVRSRDEPNSPRVGAMGRRGRTQADSLTVMLGGRAPSR